MVQGTLHSDLGWLRSVEKWELALIQERYEPVTKLQFLTLVIDAKTSQLMGISFVLLCFELEKEFL